MTNLCHEVLSTDLGWIGMLATKDGLRKIVLEDSRRGAFLALGIGNLDSMRSRGQLEEIAKLLRKYLLGGFSDFNDIPLDLSGAPSFFKSVWGVCKVIPRGETRSYKWLAEAAGRPRAARAAGQAMARNPLPIVIPCHRVIASDGSLHGYTAGSQMKATLIELERCNPIIRSSSYLGAKTGDSSMPMESSPRRSVIRSCSSEQ